MPLKDTIEAFNKISEGEFDHLPEQAFFMCGGLEDLAKKAESLGAKIRSSRCAILERGPWILEGETVE